MNPPALTGKPGRYLDTRYLCSGRLALSLPWSSCNHAGSRHMVPVASAMSWLYSYHQVRKGEIRHWARCAECAIGSR
jgi:hypothetical protein